MSQRLPVFLIDTLAIIVFAVLARLAHNTAEDPFTFINVADTFWPFFLGLILGWILIWVKADAARKIGPGVVVWIATVVVGLGIWWLRNNEVPHWSFILVASVMSALLLLGWRAIATKIGG